MNEVLAQQLATSASIVMFSSTFPQTLQTIRTKTTRDNAFLNLAPCVVGISLWVVYAIVFWQPIMIVGDGIDAVLWGIVLLYKVRNIRRRQDSWKR